MLWNSETHDQKGLEATSNRKEGHFAPHIGKRELMKPGKEYGLRF